jgi:DNA-binding NarL/FixJ family response regulator
LDIRTWRGELVVAARLAAGPTPPTVNMANLHLVGVAGYLLATGDLDTARRLLTEAAGGDDSTPYWSLIMGRLAEVELVAGRMEAAAVAAARLVAVETPRVLPWSKANVYRVDGTVRGDADALRRAVAAAADGGLVFEQARAQLALAGLVPDAVPELLAAHATFARLGVHPLRRRAANRLAELGEKVPRARSRPAGALTESEERVARLVQQGMRNREIATALHYSPRSIEVYLSRIYAKLRVSSRLELARALDALDAS